MSGETIGNSVTAALDPNMKMSLVVNKNIPTIEDELKQELLEPSNELSWDLLNLIQELPELNLNHVYDGLLDVPQPLNRTSYRFKRSGIACEVSGYSEEMKLGAIDNANSGNSLSINRKFTSKQESLRGKTSFLPFQPGGLLAQAQKDTMKDEVSFLHRNEHGLFDIPQGLSRGLSIPTASDDDIQNLGESNDDENEQIEYSKFNEIVGESSSGENKPQQNNTHDVPFYSEEIDGIVSVDYTSMYHHTDNQMANKTWAHVVDLDHKIENFEELVPNMAREWPFELDTFQKEAVYHLEQGDSVFVAAHTSAGKTVVAEYAIAMATRNMTKAIYTSPIKALSNQKFRDFKETFPGVEIGLITGDVQINPEANCLIMTTEVLRSMLYRGADLIRDVEFVIFDEVHYVNDIDRGVVWEEVIIMLPDHVKYILLSATVPNTFEFANWVGRTKQKDIYVISTPKRPVPLEVFIWAKNSLFKVIDSQRRFIESEFKKHKDALEKPKEVPQAQMGSGSRGGPGGRTRGGNRGGGRGGQVANRGRGNFTAKAGGRNFRNDGPNKGTWLTLIQYLKGNNLLPAVVFVFSKKKCEEYADSLSSIDFCNAKEKSEIHMFIDRAVSRLKKEDRELPQITKIREMLGRGIAVHHGGLLPIVKECIEILFAKTLVKVLFATETFAMGLNLPTRTVVFSSTRKNDGRSFRNLLPGEFTQMSGRAGRRGLDSTGTVIVMAYNDPLSQFDFKDVTLGSPTKLQSQFRLTYNMILNLLRIEALRVEEMIKHSFSENSTQVLLPENQKKVDKLIEQLSNIKISKCEWCNLKNVEETFQVMTEYENLYTEIAECIQKNPIIKTQLLKTGRLVCYRDKDQSVQTGFIVRSGGTSDDLLVLTFNHGDEYNEESIKYQLPYIPVQRYIAHNLPKPKNEGKFKFKSIPCDSIIFIGRYCLNANINKILDNDTNAIMDAANQIDTLVQFYKKWEELPLTGVSQINLHDIVSRKLPVLQRFKESEAFTCRNFKIHYGELREKANVELEIAKLKHLISDENLDLLPDYEQRLDVLEDLGFIDEHHNVVLKGRVACEINSGWELVITELILDNFLGDFEAEEIVALLSCFVYEGRTNEEEPPCITPRLEKGKQRILEITSKLIQKFSDKQVLLTPEEEEFVDRKRFALVNVVYEWGRGLSFNEIMLMSVEAEGTIVRVITRLDEICREVKNAALIVGDSGLHSKMNEAQERIKRDIVFCASLYL